MVNLEKFEKNLEKLEKKIKAINWDDAIPSNSQIPAFPPSNLERSKLSR